MVNKELLDIALGEYGTKEVPGEANNPRILQYFKEIGHSWVQSEWTAWCAAFVNWVAKEAGYEYTGKLNARSWLDVGDCIMYRINDKLVYGKEANFENLANYKPDKPTKGDIVILWRISKDSPYGHVGFYIREDENYVWILGGNQNNEVNIQKYPNHRVLGYRRLRKVKK
jgi:hypothetical protein